MVTPTTATVIGANGQVGLEVCLFLSSWSGISVTPVTRTEYGSALLRRFGLECRHGRLIDDGDASRILEGAKVVADFGLPKPMIGRLDLIERQVRNGVRFMPEGAKYVFISTQSVYRLDPAAARYSAYGLSKAYAEKIAMQEGRRLGREVFILRLGQVHGPLQTVSKGICRDFRAATAHVPKLPSYTIFTYSIAEALAQIASGQEKPGIYTLISTPAWSWAEVHNYYARWTGIASEVVEESVSLSPRSLLSRVLNGLRSFLVTELFRHSEAIEFWGSRVAPELMTRLRLAYYRRRAAEEIHNMRQRVLWRPYDQRIEVPGVRLKTLSDTRLIIFEENQRLLRRIETVSRQASDRSFIQAMGKSGPA